MIKKPVKSASKAAKKPNKKQTSEDLHNKLRELENQVQETKLSIAVNEGTLNESIEQYLVSAEWEIMHYEFEDDMGFVVLFSHDENLSAALKAHPRGKDYDVIGKATLCNLRYMKGNHVNLILDLDHAPEFLSQYPLKVDIERLTYDFERIVNLANLLQALPESVRKSQSVDPGLKQTN